jgi:hypothetical protein
MRTARNGQLGRGDIWQTYGEFKFTKGLDWEDIEEWRCCWLNGADGASVWGKPKRGCKRAVIACSVGMDHEGS